QTCALPIYLKGKTALVLGAGAMSSLAATQAGRLGIDKLIIANRTFDRAERLAGHAHEAGVHAEPIEFHRRTAVLDDVDVVISATSAKEFTLTKQVLPSGHNLMIIELSLLHDNNNTVAELDNVTLINSERLSDSLDAADTEVAGGADPQVAARAIVREELEAYSSAQRVREIVPAVAALRRRAADVVECELGRLQQKSPDLTDEQIGDVSQAL